MGTTALTFVKVDYKKEVNNYLNYLMKQFCICMNIIGKVKRQCPMTQDKKYSGGE